MGNNFYISQKEFKPHLVSNCPNCSGIPQITIDKDRAIQSKMLGSNSNSNLENQLNQLKSRIESNGGMNDSEKRDFLAKIESLLKMSKGSLRNTFSLDSIAAAKK